MAAPESLREYPEERGGDMLLQTMSKWVKGMVEMSGAAPGYGSLEDLYEYREGLHRSAVGGIGSGDADSYAETPGQPRQATTLGEGIGRILGRFGLH